MQAIRSFFQAVFRSCFDLDFFKSIKDQKIISSLGYLALFNLFVAIILSTAINFYLHGLLSNAQNMIDQDFPTITVKKGIVSCEAKQPYVVEAEGTRFILDTTLTSAPIQNTQGKAFVLIGKNFAAFRDEGQIETKIYDLSGIDDLTLTKELAKKIVTILYWVIAPLIMFFVALGLFILRLLQILFFSLLGLIFNKALKANLNYQNIFNLCTFAITGPILLSLIVDLSGLQEKLPSILYFYLVYAVILFLAIKHQKLKTSP